MEEFVIDKENVSAEIRIMATAILKKYWIKYFNHSLPPNQQDKGLV